MAKSVKFEVLLPISHILYSVTFYNAWQLFGCIGLIKVRDMKLFYGLQQTKVEDCVECLDIVKLLKVIDFCLTNSSMV